MRKLDRPGFMGMTFGILPYRTNVVTAVKDDEI